MKQVFLNSSGKVLVEDVVEPSNILQRGFIRVRVRSSIISSGTDRALIEGSGSGSLVRKVGQNPGLLGKVYDVAMGQGFDAALNAIRDKLNDRIPLGYSCAGEVVACGANTQGINVGDRVACAGVGYASHAEIVTVPSNLSVILPLDVDFDCAAFLALGAIAQHGVRQAQVGYGENVLIIGLGLIGQLVLLEAKASGLNVSGADLVQERLQMAQNNGADLTVNLNDGQSEDNLLNWTDGIGFDAVIITASDTSNSAFETAGRLVRDRGTISLVGVVGLPQASTFFLGKEITVRGARSYGPGRYDEKYEERGIDYPINYVRWTENRIMRLFIKNAASRRAQLERLISKRVPLADAPKAYSLVQDAGPNLFAVALNYPGPSRPLDSTPYRLDLRKSAIDREFRIGIWGVGSFAREVHLPNLSGHKQVELAAIGSGSSANATQAAKRYNAAQAFSDFDSMIESGIDGLIISSRHNEHAAQAIRALNMGISILVEKPLAINSQELDAVENAWNESNAGLMVGHNRKYCPIIERIKEEVKGRRRPLDIIYRIAAGSLRDDHWMCDIDIGGGRLVSELSHFVDTCMAIAAVPVSKVFAVYANSDKTALHSTIVFVDGSIAQVSYLPDADKGIGKEYLEVHVEGKSLRVQDFHSLIEGKDKFLIKHRRQDKGYLNELEKFLMVVKEPRSKKSISFKNHDLEATRLVFDLIRSAEAGGINVERGCRDDA